MKLTLMLMGGSAFLLYNDLADRLAKDALGIQ